MKGSLTCSLCPVDKSFANLASAEHRRSFDIIPIFPGKRVNSAKQNYILISPTDTLTCTSNWLLYTYTGDLTKQNTSYWQDKAENTLRKCVSKEHTQE